MVQKVNEPNPILTVRVLKPVCMGPGDDAMPGEERNMPRLTALELITAGQVEVVEPEVEVELEEEPEPEEVEEQPKPKRKSVGQVTKAHGSVRKR